MRFHAFGFSHLMVMLLTLLAAAVMIHWRRRDDRKAMWAERLCMAVLLAEWPLSMLAHYQLGDFSKLNALPLHVCDLAALASLLVLLTHHPLAAECSYFFGLTATLQAVITPALDMDFPHLRFFAFFAGHCTVVIVALYSVMGLRLRPRANAPLRMAALLVGYAAIVGAVNALLGTNYGFLCAKPPAASLMDVLGPWPWYLGSLIALATTLFFLLDLPFRNKRPPA